MKPILKNQVTKFLTTATPEVLAIKGSWGVGKTYAWNKWLKEIDEKETEYKRYSYVSLFGLGSIDEVKQAIFQHTQKLSSIGKESNIETLMEDPFGLSETLLRKGSSWLKNLSNLGVEPSAFDGVSYFLVNKQIICLDDLERREKSLTDSQLMGLVNQLKTEKRCKVVLIFNDAESELEGYKTFREKVVDKELEFQLSPSEAFETAFEDAENIPDNLLDCVKESALHLSIVNIRILLKIKELAIELSEKLASSSLNVQAEAMRNLVLLTWCFYETDKVAPTIEYVLNEFHQRASRTERIIQHQQGNKNTEPETASKAEQEIATQISIWIDVLEGYGYQQPTLFKQLIAKGIQAGFFDNPQWEKAIQEREAYYANSSFNQEFDAALDLYRSGFGDTYEQLVTALQDVILNNLDAVSVNNLHVVVELLRQLEQNEKANNLIDAYTTYYSNPADAERFNLDEVNYFGLVRDGVMLAKFSSHYQSLAPKTDILAILLKIGRSRDWSQQDEIILNALSQKDFEQYFLQLDGWQGMSAIKQCLKLGNQFGTDSKGQSISERATEALKAIAATSPLNKLRVSAIYNISLDD